MVRSGISVDAGGGQVQGRPRPELGALHHKMQRQGLQRVVFEGTNHGASVRTLFITDDEPMVLCIAVTHHSGSPTCAFEWAVDMPGYRVRAFLGPQYGELLDALDLDPNRAGDVPFKPGDFLSNVLSQAPKTVTAAAEPKPSQVMQLRVGTTVEEQDKVFFVGWRNNPERGQHVTAANLAKTRRLIGRECAEMCERRNISTRWSHLPGRIGEPTPTAVTADARRGFTSDWT